LSWRAKMVVLRFLLDNLYIFQQFFFRVCCYYLSAE
jgi:hypothetical protein